MKINKIKFVLLAACALLLFACADNPAAPDLPEATGEEGGQSFRIAGKQSGKQGVTGHVEVPVIGITETYSFNAIRHEDGPMTGTWQVEDKGLDVPPGQFKAHGKVTCFSIHPDGRTAWIGGVVERDDFGTEPGAEAVWTVIDKGEGKTSTDEATAIAWGYPPGDGTAAFHCETGEAFTFIPPTPIERGNVQVKP